MKKRTAILISCLTLLFNQSYAQDFKQKFNDLFSKKDAIGQKELLEKWEKVKNDDPELYIAYYNYYVAKSSKEIVTLGNNPKGENVLQIMSNDSTKKEPAGYIYGDTYYDKELLNKGFYILDKGIEKYPTRLDMRFGKIYMLGKIENYDKFAEEIIKTIDYSAVIKNQWIWEDNKPINDPENVLLGSIQDYVLQLYNTENDALFDNMRMISEAVLKYYPNNIESLSNLSIVYLLKKEYDKALEALLKAEKLNNKDFIVLNNIAQAYKLKGDSKKAVEYYELTIKYGDDRAKQHAKEEIERLKSK